MPNSAADPSRHEVYRYIFEKRVPFADVLDTFDLAMIAVESLHGEARTRLDAGFTDDTARRVLVIDASTPVGRALNQVFIGYVTREFGADAFRVRRVDRVAESLRVATPVPAWVPVAGSTAPAGTGSTAPAGTGSTAPAGTGAAERPEGKRSGARLTNAGRRLAGKIAD